MLHILKRFEQLREDKADVVAFLKRALQQRTDQISELQARLEGLQHVHETDGKSYEKKISDMKQEVSWHCITLPDGAGRTTSIYFRSLKGPRSSWVRRTWS